MGMPRMKLVMVFQRFKTPAHQPERNCKDVACYMLHATQKGSIQNKTWASAVSSSSVARNLIAYIMGMGWRTELANNMTNSLYSQTELSRDSYGRIV
jgi:hypothetical protein